MCRSSNLNSNNDEHNRGERARHKQLFVKLTKRGPTAYNALVGVLERLKYVQAIKILRPGEYGRNEFISLRRQNSSLPNNNNNSSSASTNQGTTTDGCVISIDSTDESEKLLLKVYDKEVSPMFDVKKSQKIHYGGKIPTYPMQSRHRGVFFLVNIIDFKLEKRRSGSDIDAIAMIHLFREMGFTIFYYENLYQGIFHQLLDELIESKYTAIAECFVMCIMSHGAMDNGVERVEFYGGGVEDLRNILDKFRNSVCKNLVGKPKILIFPFCRGEISDRGHMSSDVSPYKSRIETDHIDVKLPRNIPTYSDILICYASVPGFRTHRDPDDGSWYIQEFCEVFANHAHDTHVEDLLKMVGEKAGNIRTTDNKLQTASHVNLGFYRKLYFNPGFYKD